jgi:hypothetical protein
MKSTQINRYESRKAIEINQNIPKPTLSSGKEYLVISRIKLEQLDVTHTIEYIVLYSGIELDNRDHF